MSRLETREPGRAARGDLRVAIVTGSLGKAGAEKQAFYIGRALAEAGVGVRVFSLSHGQFYEHALRALAVETSWFGQSSNPGVRLVRLIRGLRAFRPHVIQSIHAYTNLYSAITGRMLGAISVGGLRGDVGTCLRDHGRLTRLVLASTDGLVANSRRALDDPRLRDLLENRPAYFLANGIDLKDYRAARPASTPGCTFLCVGRLIRSKRADVFLRALALASAEEPSVRGVILGDGPDRASLIGLARRLRLGPGRVSFEGYHDDVASVLATGSAFVLTSVSEGTPNVVLEAMASSLPVIATPAGDAGDLVERGRAGFVVPFGDVDAVAHSMLRLARDPALRCAFGSSGRAYVERQHATSLLADRLLGIYTGLARSLMESRPASARSILRTVSEA